jgi:hypothetical protein
MAVKMVLVRACPARPATIVRDSENRRSASSLRAP